MDIKRVLHAFKLLFGVLWNFYIEQIPCDVFSGYFWLSCFWYFWTRLLIAKSAFQVIFRPKLWFLKTSKNSPPDWFDWSMDWSQIEIFNQSFSLRSKPCPKSWSLYVQKFCSSIITQGISRGVILKIFRKFESKKSFFNHAISNLRSKKGVLALQKKPNKIK